MITAELTELDVVVVEIAEVVGIEAELLTVPVVGEVTVEEISE